MTNNYILLLGAGFSKNWGGWLASDVEDFLFTQPSINENGYLTEILNEYSANKGGFEAALADVQHAYELSPTEDALKSLRGLQDAITKMFEAMDQGFSRKTSIDFTSDVNFKVSRFLGRFDAIFTLNQDLLLERHYSSLDLPLAPQRKWSGWSRPGLRPLSTENSGLVRDCGKERWTPVEPFMLSEQVQPVFKLHGSSDLWSFSGEPMLIMGADKERDIKRHPLLNWYHEQFERFLKKPNTRLMVIGYGGADTHINNTIAYAHQSNPDLSLFIIDPKDRSQFPESFKKLRNIGRSSQALSETFSGDVAEINKIHSFFS